MTNLPPKPLKGSEELRPRFGDIILVPRWYLLAVEALSLVLAAFLGVAIGVSLS